MPSAVGVASDAGLMNRAIGHGRLTFPDMTAMVSPFVWS
jgi:hypothetical protein